MTAYVVNASEARDRFMMKTVVAALVAITHATETGHRWVNVDADSLESARLLYADLVGRGFWAIVGGPNTNGAYLVRVEW